MLPGAQVLFGFLLTVPFNGRFAEVDGTGRVLYCLALLGVAGATVMFLTPAAFHRRIPTEQRHTHVRLGGRLTMVGLAFLAAAMATGLGFVIRFIDRDLTGMLAGAVIGGAAVLLWFVLPPLVARRRLSR